MPFINFEGQVHYVPGVYTSTKVVSSLPGPLPAFHIPVILGHATHGRPYNVDSKITAVETAPGPYQLCRTEAKVAELYGAESDVHRAARVAFRHGLPFAFVGGMSDMVRASIVVDDGGGTPVEQFTLYPRQWGPAPAWAKIKWDGTTWTTTPVKRYAMLAANAGASATRLYLAGDHTWLTEGAAVVVGSNTVAGVAATVAAVGVELGTDGQRDYWIELAAAAGSALNTSEYALVLQYADRDEVSPDLATCQALIDWLNASSSHWIAVKHANFDNTDPASVATATAMNAISAWGAVVDGTCPASVTADYTGLVAALNAGAWDAFLIAQGLIPHTYLVADGASAVHAAMRDYATAQRALGYPIAVVTGCRWGDVVLDAGDDTDPLYRAVALNSQDVQLVANGADREAAYISRAAAVFGRRVAGGPAHNLTNDEFVFSEDEVRWDEINSGELSALARRGVVSNKLSIGQTFRYRVSQGSSTLQANATIWNTSDATTWSTMQRDLADYVERVIKTDFEELVIGADKVTEAGVAQLLQRRAERSLVARGYIKPGGFAITAITLNDAGNGYDVAWTVRLPDTVDYLTVTTSILIG